MESDEKTTPKHPSSQSPKDAWLEQIIAEDRDYGFVLEENADE